MFSRTQLKIGVTIVALSLSIGAAQAQVPATSGIELTMSTDTPRPGQEVTVVARSYSFDIHSSNLVWAVDGKVVQRGVGLTTYVVKAPALGKKLAITVSATDNNGTQVSKSITLGSGSIDLIVETDGYVPPFFRGKVSPVYQNTVKIIAVPHLANAAGVEIDPKTLVYRWSRSGRLLEEQSGYGKQSISIVGDIVPRPFVLEVEISTKDGSTKATNLITIDAGEPFILFYVDDPLYGALYNRAVGENLRIGSQKEVRTLASPFGFNKKIAAFRGNLEFSWNINGINRPELDSNQSVILRAPDETAGTSLIELRIRNLSDILQGAQAGFRASFSKSES